jgi:hypothetical protein
VAIPARLGEGHVAHDGARHRARAVAHERTAHDTPAPVGTDDDGRAVRAAIGLDAHARSVAREVQDAFALAQLDPAVARRPRERRVELAPADDAAEVAAGDSDGTPTGDGDPRTIDARVGNGEGHTELLGQAERLWDDAAGAGLVAGMAGLVEEHRAGGELGRQGGEAERGRGPGGPRADDDDLAPLHGSALSAAARRPPPAPALTARPGEG